MRESSFKPAQILLPKNDFENWAVVACDQFTSEQKYWNDVEKTVGDKVSTLHIILPEIYLEDEPKERIKNINKNMSEYLDGDVFEVHDDSMIYVERMQKNGKIRHGIVGLIDLEDYDYRKGSNSLIRATEQTVLERIPPRVEIRKDASLELPHVMLLIDDPNHTVIEPLKNNKKTLKEAYNFDLMQNGGHIEGYFLDKEKQVNVSEALNKLVENKEDKLMFAVGDGNHSLATAKECYNLSKSPLARYALVEIVNIHDDSIEFEPIYRVLFNVDAKDFINKLNSELGNYDGDDSQEIKYISRELNGKLNLKPTSKLPVGTLQTFTDKYLRENPGVKIDYIHGEDVVEELCKKENSLGFIFKGMEKSELFEAVKADGSLPRKTFSMGHASDKRYYIECRKIK